MASLWLWLLFSLLSTLSGVCAGDATISPLSEASGSQLASLMHLQLTAPEIEVLQLTYSVYPLTEHAGLNRSDINSIWIRGSLVAAENVLGDVEGSERAEAIAFLSCDAENATEVVNQLMENAPKAILLYSTGGNCCSLEGDDLTYTSIYTMGDAGEARDTMNNTVRAGGILRATITGNSTMASAPSDTPEQGGSNSAVAMSILYSITGLITLLFLVIIGTGAIRAHRYPERYGPRSGYGGRPSQSRAKGLARAVLETLPIVKFGDPSSAKTDPSLELESQPSATAPDPAMGTRLSSIPEEPRTPHAPRNDAAAPMSGAVPEAKVTPASGPVDDTLGVTSANNDGTKADCSPTDDEHLGCSICTEDFTVGEDVRVLPCDHKFHPPCIDPWLINVSGTCPLCRLDLRPQGERTSSNPDQDDGFPLAPPLLASTETWNDTTATTPQQQQQQQQQRRRSSRFLDLHRLRHASIEERIEILRRHRSQQQLRESTSNTTTTTTTTTTTSGSNETEEQRGRRARLADRLRERFHIRTRAQSPPARGGTTATTTAATAETNPTG
ncbi:E3 ubiquitin-protein ligase SDIR1 [Chaetomidium leptoderma]|uniref:RING-type E3 ubiquitin transferase n=1 Tax=Chaetomidium leptoderma TaxID=669021 RepID=A0AAN6VRW8_9PEZI|nr:E3 ubiquitin-protein ligase SDIR1 [Chaetomidium leptoderma]